MIPSRPHLVVLDVPPRRRREPLAPRLVLRHRVERQHLPALLRLDDRRDELDEEAGDAQQRGVERVEEVHDEPLDVAAVVVLVGHDHERAVAQRLDVVVLLAVLQAEDLLDVLDLDVLGDLAGGRVAHVEELAPGGCMDVCVYVCDGWCCYWCLCLCCVCAGVVFVCAVLVSH